MKKIFQSPIITSILDTDAYKLHMQQAVFHYYKKVFVVAELQYRNQEILKKYIYAIRYQINLMKNIHLTQEEYFYLNNFSYFKKDYLNWLRNFRFDPNQVAIYSSSNNSLRIRISGYWCKVILWEVPLLSMVSELVHKDRYPKKKNEKKAIQQLYLEIEGLLDVAKKQGINLKYFKIVDFGTRRRFSRSIHYRVVRELKKNFPYFVGTSNYHLAKKLHVLPFGTQSHEWFQAHQQISHELLYSQKEALKIWLNEYPKELGIAITDCITMNSFLKDFDLSLAKRYAGLRHDSGDPVEWAKKAIEHYDHLKINTNEKTLVFSDNLDLQQALHLYKIFYKKINLVFGIGTKLTCNIPGVNPLNIVIKLTECNGKPVAKISDSPKKTICKDPNFIKQLVRAFNLF
ncbi:nicotinate phosphoribosyltransferase [Candidatus Riesia pediculischaeffi]|uniref:Nicotinate phosphoribosyltransferase n=2 Tax=Candidatus Riesia pediculischaeffi TaxID=428411 RepID=A0A1V0HKM5_9ENTR|nr:nicotinate phosphoribosyltransferase [Candidatus Riesia pediculischaeffi]ARC53378.1 nicotinate phosphoribosyltransferase [Candidatus Riesia pediculischaeffi]KIE63870.1 Nicotinate phosphoribosyltransferase [Candidatus Riesia pediculischaeffi PTSU]